MEDPNVVIHDAFVLLGKQALELDLLKHELRRALAEVERLSQEQSEREEGRTS